MALGLRRIIDGAPFTVRLASVAASAFTVIAAATMEPLALAGAAAAVGATVGAARLRGVKYPGLPRAGGVNAVGFEVTVSSSRSASELARLVRERSRLGRARIGVFSVLDSGASKAYIVVYAGSRGDVETEAEVLKTLIKSLVDDARVSDIPVETAERLASSLSGLAPGRGGYPVIAVGQKTLGTSGQVLVGYRRGSSEPVSLDEDDIAGHVAIFGSTGSGKSTTLSVVSCGASHGLGARVLVLDWAGEHGSKLETAGCKPKKVDPLAQGSLNPLAHISSGDDVMVVVEALGSTLGLTEPQEYMLMRIIEEQAPSTLRELEEEVAAAPEASKWDREVKRALLRKISLLTRGSSYRAFEGGNFDLEIEGGVTAVDLSRIEGLNARRAYALLLLWLASKKARPGDPIVASIDEAQNIALGEEGLLSRLMAEARKTGLYMAIASQSPSLMPLRVIANSNTKIVHSLRSHRDIEVVRDSMNLPEGVARELPSLHRGEAVIHSPSNPEPILVKISSR